MQPDNEVPLTERRPPHEKELHIAPMLNVSKREFRKLFSILSTKAVLWTDMVVDSTIAYSEKLEDVLEGDVVPNVQVCQIGGNSPEMCGEATRSVAELYGYQEVNLNIDCPSDLVSLEREFGAILMKKAETAFAVVEAMQKSAPPGIPISVKCRVGVDDWDNLEFIADFVERLRPVCKNFYLHARKCVLTGLMKPKQNRNVPPLNFPRVYTICNLYPDCNFWINGGIRTLAHARSICFGDGNEASPDRGCHQVPCASCNYPNGSCTAPPSPTVPVNLRGCMLGRAAMENPAIFADTDRYFYGLEKNPCRNRRQVFDAYCSYLEELYPRRCCDDNPEITYKLPVPDVRPEEGKYCPVCRPTFIPESEPAEPMHEEAEISKSSGQSRMAPRLLRRAIIPIRGMLYGLPNSRRFNHRLDVLGHERGECGPGYIIRQALKDTISDELLDQEFLASEVYCTQRFH
jgi:tRNA-dihydrouridine synthase A